MAAKNSVQVLVGGKVIRLTGYESEEYLEKVASYLNHKLGELSQLGSWRRLTADTKNTLLSLNICDDYFKAKRKAEELEEELTHKDKEFFDLKQELVDLQIELDELKKSRSREHAAGSSFGSGNTGGSGQAGGSSTSGSSTSGSGQHGGSGQHDRNGRRK